MPDGPAIALKQIGKRFADGPLVLDAVTINAEPGEIVAVVGPSGCGKSTLLRIIAGLLEPTSGTIKRSGENFRPAFIFQDATLLPWTPVLDNIALPLRLKGVDRARRHRIARDWADRVGLSEAIGYFPRELSGGMRMRVSIARALSLQPSLLLLDEPFGALDAITRNRLNEVLLKLHAGANWTAFFVTHSVTEAVFLSNRIVIMGNDPGRVSAIIENPLHSPRNSQTRESVQFQQRVAETTARLHEVLTHETE